MDEEMSFKELQEIVSVCLEQIISLKEENQKLQNEIELLSISLDRSQIKQYMQENAIANMKYELSDPRMNGEKWGFPKFYEIEDTIKCIVDKKKSMARFGDGEFEIMSGKERAKFQHWDEKLAGKLKEVIQKNEDGFLIAIADNYGNLEKFNDIGKGGIRDYMKDDVRKEHLQYLDLSRVYHNAYISRPYVFYNDNMTDAPRKRFEALKRIWEKRNIIFVEGALTRMGVGNDLFDNASSIKRIEAPPVNSFDKYDEILEATLKYADKDSLFLIALGPAAGVLAYDLYSAGYQAIDIGHIDLEYEWFLRGKGERCPVKNKYNHEFVGGNEVEDICDEEYLKQIIWVVE